MAHNEAVRSIYDIDNAELANAFATQIGNGSQDDSRAPEIRRLGRTITKWRQHPKPYSPWTYPKAWMGR